MLRNDLILKAKSARKITVTGNTIISEKKLDENLVILINDCEDVEVAENQFIVD